MSPQDLQAFWPFGVSILMLFVIGFYCVIGTFNLIRVLIGLELLLKAVTLLIIAVGCITRHGALTQALVITFIVIEVVVMAVAVGVVLGIRRHNNSLDTRNIKDAAG